MKTIICLFAIIFCTNFVSGQNNQSIYLPSTYILEESRIVAGVPEKPTITYNLESSANKSYSFRAYSSGATEYEWHIQPTSNISNSFYRGSSEIVVQFKAPMSSTQVVCRAKNSSGWSDYTVISVDIKF